MKHGTPPQANRGPKNPGRSARLCMTGRCFWQSSHELVRREIVDCQPLLGELVRHGEALELLPVGAIRWHAKQWHIALREGSPSTVR